jgi:hypothetical protein
VVTCLSKGITKKLHIATMVSIPACKALMMPVVELALADV